MPLHREIRPTHRVDASVFWVQPASAYPPLDVRLRESQGAEPIEGNHCVPALGYGRQRALALLPFTATADLKAMIDCFSATAGHGAMVAARAGRVARRV